MDAVATTHPALSLVLNYVCSSLVGYAGRRGISPYAPLNIERVVSSLRLLADRTTHEAAPFVAWSAVAEEFDEHVADKALSDSLMKAVSERLAEIPSNLEQPMVKLVRRAMGPGTGDTYRKLDRVVIEAVTRILSTFSSVDYLAPLARLATSQGGGLDVATLNYDLTVETMCEQQGVEVSRGFATSADEGLAWSQRGVRLHKLHGSVDWCRIPVGRDGANFARGERYVRGERVEICGGANSGYAPAIILGDRDKVGSSGLTVDLLAAFATALRRANSLVVVGYSFSDGHINDMVTSWANGDQQRQLVVVDKHWSTPAGSYRASLSDGLLECESWRADQRTPRMSVLTQATADGLEAALGQPHDTLHRNGRPGSDRP